MNELLTYVAIVKTIADRIYGKEVIFYDNGQWYSREHSRYISDDEVAELTIGLVTDLQTELAEKEREKEASEGAGYWQGRIDQLNSQKEGDEWPR
ncbi:hypothetical protein [Salibacterium aidingense]|uniref:hypothetical protein n=1 Tax=Salibacterium aidingense TaxID=384933 RepID=UPI003BDB003D